MSNLGFRVAAVAAMLVAATGGGGPARGQGHAGHSQAPTTPATTGPVRITMEALHAAGGVPPGWHFTLPPGDAAAGRRTFVDFKCYTCHAVRGEQFPLKPGEAATAGPDLTGMGAHHPTEYLVESILNPNAVLVEGAGYIGGDGRSIMPSSPEMTVAQLVDLVAYLKSLGGDAGHVHDPAHEQTAGGYRIRLVYRGAAATGQGEHAHHQHGNSAMAGAGKGRLLAFVADVASGQPVPYLPVTARLGVPGRAATTVKLAPAFGDGGFHYGADVTLPENTRKVTVVVGPAALKVLAGASPQLARAQTVIFDWK